MELKNVLHTEKVVTRNKTYFLDLKKAENGRDYLLITQRKQSEEDQPERIKMILFEEELQKFGEAFVKILFNFNASSKNKNRITEEEIEELRKIYPRAYEPWTQEDDDQLRIMTQEGHSLEKLASFFQRKESAVLSRMNKLNLLLEQAV